MDTTEHDNSKKIRDIVPDAQYEGNVTSYEAEVLRLLSKIEENTRAI